MHFLGILTLFLSQWIPSLCLPPLCLLAALPVAGASPGATELPVVGSGTDLQTVNCNAVVEAQLPKQEVCTSVQRAVAALCVCHKTNSLTTQKEIRQIFTLFPEEYRPGRNESVCNTTMNQKFPNGIPKKKARDAIGDTQPSKTMTIQLPTYRNIGLSISEA